MRKLSIQFRLRLSLVIVLGAAFLKLGAWPWLGIYAIIALFWVIAFQVPMRSLSKLLGAELLLLSVIAIPLSWERASFLLVRSLICLLIMNSFLLTLPTHSFGVALKGLPLPQGLQESVLLAGQYLEILLSEVNRMQRAAQCRGLSGPAGWLRYASISMIGSLYIRSLQRAERVYGAMIVRGYQGSLPVETQTPVLEHLALFATILVAGGLTFASYWNF